MQEGSGACTLFQEDCVRHGGIGTLNDMVNTMVNTMVSDWTARNAVKSPLCTIQALIQERYPDACAIFWAGSVSQGRGAPSSDLDLVIVYDSLLQAYREAFVYDGWPIDAFIHDLDTVRFFCGHLEPNEGKPSLAHMILTGLDMREPNEYSSQAKRIAAQALAQGPHSWTGAQIDTERFLITDIVHDIRDPQNKAEQVTSAVHLFEPLLQFYVRARNAWAASGKSLMRLFQQDNPELANQWVSAFEKLVQTGDSTAIETVWQGY